MSDEDISFNLKDVKAGFSKVTNFFKDKKAIIISVAVILAVLILVGVLIRIQNISLLKDQATGQYIPLALDPFYWLRVAHTIVQTGGLPAIDPYRHIVGGAGFTQEISPWVIAGFYQLLHYFNHNITLGFADVIYPVVFFALGLIGFFFLVRVLTKSKIAALISSAFLVVLPTYLYRTMAGFSDHNALGLSVFFLVLVAYTYSLIELNKKGESEKQIKKNLIRGVIFGAILGFLTALAMVSWGGISEFIPMIVPLGFFILWIMKARDLEWKEKKDEMKKLLAFYITFLVVALFSVVLFNFSVIRALGKIMTNTTSFMMGFVLLFVIFDFLIMKFENRIPIAGLKRKHILWSLGIAVLLGILAISVHEGLSTFLASVLNRISHPFGSNRIALTVAEYAQTYATDWISQTGHIFFWLFFGGVIALGINLSSGVKGKWRKVWFIFFWALMIVGLLLGRFSSTSVLNGTSFLSKLLLYGGIILFIIYAVVAYVKKNLDLSAEQIALFSITIVMLVAANTAAYIMVIVSPFTCIFIGYLIVSLARWLKKTKKKEKDELLKMFLFLALAGVLIASIFSISNLANEAIVQAKYTGPSANYEWQYGMKWVQNNTPLNATFAQWWDYGYWIQYLGNRSTIADGGHFEGSFMDHMIGRYLLTEPNPNITLSFLKSNNISDVLIDPSDLGKYPAYSIIGSGAAGTDRYSSVPIMSASSSQTQTVGNTTIRAYQNVVPTDQDIVYNTTQGQIFIPQGKAYTVGVLVNTTSANNGSSTTFGQPQMILYYNNQQFKVPMQYVYYNGHLIDFHGGYPGGIYILSSLTQSSTTYSIDPFGSVIYMSPKVFSSFFAQMYLMNDPFNKYPTITMAHEQYDQLLQALHSQGFSGEFIFYNGQFDGPLNIWSVKYPDYILSKKQFTLYQAPNGNTFGDNFDNLTVVNQSLINQS